MKEATTSAQDDLILLRDVGILTDGQYSIKKDGYQQCNLESFLPIYFSHH